MKFIIFRIHVKFNMNTKYMVLSLESQAYILQKL